MKQIDENTMEFEPGEHIISMCTYGLQSLAIYDKNIEAEFIPAFDNIEGYRIFNLCSAGNGCVLVCYVNTTTVRCDKVYDENNQNMGYCFAGKVTNMKLKK